MERQSPPAAQSGVADGGGGRAAMAWSRQCCREHATTVHGASNFAHLNRKISKLSGKSPQVAPESGGAAPSGDEVVSFTRRIMGGNGQLSW